MELRRTVNERLFSAKMINCFKKCIFDTTSMLTIENVSKKNTNFRFWFFICTFLDFSMAKIFLRTHICEWLTFYKFVKQHELPALICSVLHLQYSMWLSPFTSSNHSAQIMTIRSKSFIISSAEILNGQQNKSDRHVSHLFTNIVATI